MSTLAERLSSLTPEQRALFAMRVRERQRGGAQARVIPAAMRRSGEAYPLSFAQQRLWFLHQLQPDSPLYNTFLTVRLAGVLDRAALHRGLEEIVRRNEVLRTTFIQPNGSPMQCIQDEANLTLRHLVLDFLLPGDRETAAREAVLEEIRRPFDLESGPVIRALLVDVASGQHILVLTMHHIVSDRWSMDVLVRDLSTFYTAYSTNTVPAIEPLSIQYMDFALWQRSPERAALLDRQLAWWMETLHAPLPTADLPCDHPRPAVYSPNSGRVTASLSSAVIDALLKSGRQDGATLFMTLLAAAATLLFRHCAQDEIVVGTPIVNRAVPETAPLIGCFVNTLALRIDGSGNPSWREFQRRVRSVCLGAYERQDVPFEWLVDGLKTERSLSETPLFQVMFALNDAHEPTHGGRTLASALVANGLTLSPFEVESNTVAADLVIRIERQATTTECIFEYRTSLFENSTIVGMVRRFEMLLGAIASDPMQRLNHLPVLVPGERHLLLNEWSRTATPLSAATTITERVRQNARIAPDAPAVSGRFPTLSREDLDLRARRLAALLCLRGVGPDTIVGVCMDRTPEMIVALLGVLYAGGAYLALDTSHPRERLAWILDDSRTELVLTTSGLASRLSTAAALIRIDCEPALDSGSPLPDPVPASPENLAYVVYTSGSTGRPKGVAVTRRGLSNLVGWHIDRYQVSAEDRMSQVASLGFDASVWEIWAALGSGAELFLVQEDDRVSAARVWKWLCEQRITLAFLPTPLAEAVLTLPQLEPCHLRALLTGGDRLRSYPGAPLKFSLFNHYGPSECSVVTTASEPLGGIPMDGSPPIGRPIAHTEVFVLDKDLFPLPPGVRGELYVGGEGLARGYLGRPDLTAERFIPHPFGGVNGARLYRTGDWVRYGSDGVLEFLGRRDGQIKIRGFRVELGEIECSLVAHRAVREATVVVRVGGGSLVAYIVAEAGATLSNVELREWTRQRLPAYMVPAMFVLLAELPLNANGKVDRLALAALPLEASANVLPPHTLDEQALAEIWIDLLSCQPPGVNEDFFAMGGHSLLATQLISRIRACLQIEVPLRDAFEHPTIGAMAARIQELRNTENGLIRPRLAGRASSLSPPLSFAQRRLWFIAQLEPESPVYNIPFAIRMRGELNRDALQYALDEIVSRHETLRSRFLDRGGQAALEIVPSARPEIVFVNLSAEPPEQRDSLARCWCAVEARRPFHLAAEPPFRAACIRVDADEHILALTLHHIAADGWSVGVLAREFAALYRTGHDGSCFRLPELAIKFSDYAAWQSEWLDSQVKHVLLDYWRHQLDGAVALELFYDHPRPPAPSHRAGAVPFAIESVVWSNLRRIAQEEGATGFMLLFAAWALLLSRYSGQLDIVVGTDIAGRDQAETEQLIGLFVNQLALRITIDPGDTFRTLLRKARTVLIDAYAHQGLPFEALVEALAPARDLSRHPLFQCKLALEDPVPALELPLLETSLFAAGDSTIKTDLRMAVRLDRGRVDGRIEFALDLFQLTTVEKMATRFATLLSAVASAPDDAVGLLPLISHRESHRLLLLGRGREKKIPSIAIHELFEQQVAEIPDAPAIVCGSKCWSYSELNQRADRLASMLLSLGAKPEIRVGVCLDRDQRAILAILAVLKTGAAYVPMDPAFPTERLVSLMHSAGVTILIAARRLCSALAAGAADILCLDDDAEFAAQPFAVRSRAEPANLAYLIFTSGSTGSPKAVGIEHRNLVNYVVAVSDRLQPVRGRRFALLSTLAADLGNTTLFASLCGGGILHVIPEQLASDPDDVAQYFDEQAIECVKIAPSHLSSLLSARLPVHVLPSALLVLGGEAASYAWIRELRALRPECQILNHYGPTEATVGALTASITSLEDAASFNIPLGTPLSNTNAYVLDAEGNLAPEGIPGELYLGGDGLARGYLNAPAQTAERFLPDPFSAIPGKRMYRTGDRARWTEAGVIEFLGRIDRQVKVRGYRVEPGEIEAALNQHPDITHSAVALIEDSSRGAYVAAWFVTVPGHAPLVRDLRSFLEQRLPAYMLPALLAAVPALPLLANGKLDRRALPEPSWGDRASDIPEAPRTPTEAILAGIWESVMGIDRILPQDNFFELGGHSLLATRVASRVREAFAIPLGVRAIFECRTLADLAGRIDADRLATVEPPPPLVAAPRDRSLPLSFSEQRLWFLQRFAPDDRSYLVPIVLRLSGELSTSALEAAFNETARRHEILRTCFPTEGDLPIRLVAPDSPWPLPVVDLRATAEGEHELQRRIEAENKQPFDLTSGPLMRTRLYRLGDDEHVLLVMFHHIISDAWSAGVLLAEIGRWYESGGTQTSPPLAIQYSDFAFWQREWLRGDALGELLDWWRARLADAPPLQLPADRRPAPVRSPRGASCSITLDPSLTQATKACARTAGGTDFIVLLAAFASTLARFSGQPDLSIGTPVSGRIHTSLEPLLGCFVNILVLRCILDGDPTFVEILARVRETTLAAWDHQQLPFEKLVEDLKPERAQQSTPLFQVMFMLQEASPQNVAIGGVRFEQVVFETGTAKFDLTLVVRQVSDPAGSVRYDARLEYRRDRFERATVEQLLNSFHCLLASAVETPEKSLSSLQLLAPDKRDQLLVQSRATQTYACERLVHNVFADCARRMPDAVALEYGASVLRYGELDVRANQLAHLLRSLGAGPETLVAVCLHRSAELVIALLAILKAGAAYLPLDAADPISRLAFVLADAGALDRGSLIAVTTSDLAAELLAAGATQLVLLDDDAETIGKQSVTAPEVCADSENLAYVMYTSGSTGTPKGVAVTHRAILRLVVDNTYAAITHADVLLQLAPVGFDASTFEIWGALLNGASIAIVPPGVPSLAEISNLLVRHKISTLWLTAGLFRLMVDEQIDSLRGVRQLLAGGDVLPMAQVRRVLEELPACRLINGYGPTENTTFTCCHTLEIADLEASSIPIGCPIANTEAFVLDENMQLVPPGARGELYAGGAGLARGYHARPDLSAERFVPHPFSLTPGARLYRTGDAARWRSDRSIEFLGRTDGQVKIRGFRVEAGEIEAVLGGHPSVGEAIVVARDDAQGNRTLAAFVTASAGVPVDAQGLSDYLRQRLPHYMTPSTIVTLDRLPLTTNGKIDRAALAARSLAAPGSVDSFATPRTPDEQALAAIWQELLGMEDIGIHANFFELGGHSLLAAQLVSRIERKLGIVVPLRLMFENATIATLAEAIEVLRWIAENERVEHAG